MYSTSYIISVIIISFILELLKQLRFLNSNWIKKYLKYLIKVTLVDSFFIFGMLQKQGVLFSLVEIMSWEEVDISISLCQSNVRKRNQWLSNGTKVTFSFNKNLIRFSNRSTVTISWGEIAYTNKKVASTDFFHDMCKSFYKCPTIIQYHNVTGVYSFFKIRLIIFVCL